MPTYTSTYARKTGYLQLSEERQEALLSITMTKAEALAARLYKIQWSPQNQARADTLAGGFKAAIEDAKRGVNHCVKEESHAA